MSDGMADEWELLARWRAGDADAGSDLVRRYFAPISRFFRSKVGNDVDDLIQQTFLACVEGRDRIQGGGFRGYLFGVARRRLFDHVRDRYKAREIDFSVSSLADLRTTPSEGIARTQRAQLIQSALLQIPAEAQIALELAYWEGLSGPEIAVALDVELGTVRSRLTRARQRLREVVLSMGGDASDLFGTDPVPET
jgi:RNA polymerase sigma-70 factor (ECF subfamily)